MTNGEPLTQEDLEYMGETGRASYDEVLALVAAARSVETLTRELGEALAIVREALGSDVCGLTDGAAALATWAQQNRRERDEARAGFDAGPRPATWKWVEVDRPLTERSQWVCSLCDELVEGPVNWKYHARRCWKARAEKAEAQLRQRDEELKQARGLIRTAAALFRHGAEPVNFVRDADAFLAEPKGEAPCPTCVNGIVRTVGMDNAELIEDCPDCQPGESQGEGGSDDG